MKLSDQVEFLITHSGYMEKKDAEKIEHELSLHRLYGTLVEVVHNKLGIVGMARFNWISHDTVEVIDAVIHKKFRSKNLLKHMLLKAKTAMPQMKNIVFSREKHGGRKSTYNIDRFLGVKSWVVARP